jgi:hypothetical protein
LEKEADHVEDAVNTVQSSENMDYTFAGNALEKLLSNLDLKNMIEKAHLNGRSRN